MQTAWKQKTKRDRILLLLRVIASAGAFVLAMLRLFHVWDPAINIAMPLLGSAMLIQSVQEWRQDRTSAIINLCAALFIFVCCAVVWSVFY